MARGRKSAAGQPTPDADITLGVLSAIEAIPIFLSAHFRMNSASPWDSPMPTSSDVSARGS